MLICQNCGRSKKLNDLIGKNCDTDNGLFRFHNFQEEQLCSCGHGISSHYLKNGIVQCSQGNCFPFFTHNIHGKDLAI